MSSFSESRLSVLIVKQSFSQMRAGLRSGANCGNVTATASTGRACPQALLWNSHFPRGSSFCPLLNAMSLSAITCAPPTRRGPPAPPTARAICTPAATAGQGRRAGRHGAHQQIRLPGPVRARAHGRGVSGGGLVRQRAARGRRRRLCSEHLVGGRPVERLRIADECLNTKAARTGRMSYSCQPVTGSSQGNRLWLPNSRARTGAMLCGCTRMRSMRYPEP